MLPPKATRSAMPSDIDPQSGFRLPLPNRDDLDDIGKAAYDRGTKPGATMMGLQGPAGIQLYTKATPHLVALNQYLRFKSGISPRIREITILTVAREMDSQFEWAAHEPEALSVGVPADVVEAIKHRRATAGLDETDATVIELGRQIWQTHKVTSELFAKAKALFGASMVIDIVLLMGNYASTAAMLATVDMQLHEGSEPLLPVP
jgi:4-carboxymuconolactone decarboxylase